MNQTPANKTRSPEKKVNTRQLDKRRTLKPLGPFKLQRQGDEVGIETEKTGPAPNFSGNITKGKEKQWVEKGRGGRSKKRKTDQRERNSKLSHVSVPGRS